MSTPDVRVRLTPEGIKEVIFALREIQKEASKANKNAATGLGLIKSELTSLKSLLPTLGLAAAVAGFAAMTKQALNTADQTGKLQQRVGGTVEEISGLTLAFKTNESNQEGLQQALQKTSQVIAGVKAESTDTIAALQAIGVNTDQLKNLSAPRALEEIARKLQAIPPGADRANAAFKIFGKQSDDLIVALDAVGKQGIDGFIEKARQLGVLVDDELAGAAARANDALGIIKIQAQGLATQFAAGLAPAVADAMETFSEAVTGDGTNGMRIFGEVVGFIVRLITTLFVGMGKVIGATIAKVGSFIGSVKDAATAVAGGDLSGALEALRRGARERLQIEQDLQSDLADLSKKLFAGPKPNDPRAPGGQNQVTPPPGDEAKKTAAARTAFLKQQLQNELKLQQEALKLQEQENKAAYERGLISLTQFYDKRREIAQRAAKAEIDALKLERAQVATDAQKAGLGGGLGSTEAERIKLKQQLAALTAEINQKELALARELSGINDEQLQAQKQLNDERLGIAAKLEEAEGNRHAQFQRNLDLEIRQIRELGIRAGEAVDEIEAKVQRLTAARTAQFDFEEATRKGEQALQAFTRDAEQIRRDQEAGIITQLEGEQRLIELERQRIVVLQQLAAALLKAAEATGSEEQIGKAQAFAASVDQIAASYRAATDVASKFESGAVEAVQSGIQSLLSNAENIESLGDAFRSLARTIASALQDIAAEILAKQATLALARAFGIGVARKGGYVRGYAAGGDIAGKQLPIPGPDKIPILAQKGEFMLRKARVQEPGALDFLRRWNAGAFTLAQARRMQRFAKGGEIGPGTAAAAAAGTGGGGAERPIVLRSINLLDPGLVNEALASASGERTMLNVIERNSTTIKRMLG
jgi:hypothetical protein